MRADNRPGDLTGAAVTLEIWDTRSDDVLLYSASEADAVITVGEQVTVVIPPDTAVYQDLQAGYKYRYGLTVVHPALDFRVQGTWQLLRKYGTAQAGPNDWTLSVTDQTITINGGTGPQGEQGLIGPAGPWEATSRLATTSGAILATDTLVFARAGGADIELSCPDPADLWDGVNGRIITIARVPEDTGTVTITGTADGLPLELFSSAENLGESVYITTTDGVTLLVSDAPFVVANYYDGNFAVSGSIQYANDTRPASEALRGTRRYVEGINYSREEMVMKVGTAQWAWVTTVEEIF